MIDNERWREAGFGLANLATRHVDPSYLEKLHGLKWPMNDAFDRDFARFLTSRKISPPPDGKVDRYAFEMFLQSQRMASRNEMAAALGMRPESLDAVIPRLGEIGLSRRYDVYEQGFIIDEALKEDLIQALDGLRFRTFGTHDSFCELLHNRLRSTLNDEVEIEGLFCKTADRLGEQRRYASMWDAVNLEPLSVGHDVWLDFGKPIMLPPDCCSKLFYAENQEEMHRHLAGGVEPTGLDAYLEAVGRPA